ncbi:perlucin-like protein [Ruditapes philippinarum]|uniref:perlucin-like protein n=1 Tax=Ruditapes philippinarum TaxID=129788 RepID=UPI00295A8EF3|nr:perlucin-like protein [Ruditapes philippinarum]
MWNFYFLLILCSLSWRLHASTSPNGWMRHDKSCYHFSHDQEDWPNAMTMCHILGGKLVEIESAAENAFLISMATRFNKNYWIALSDIQEEGVWVWMETKNPISETEFSYWHPGEPDNGHQNENCGTLNGIHDNGLWNDWHCSDPTVPYICEIPDGFQEIVG